MADPANGVEISTGVEILTVAELAARVRRSPRTARRWARKLGLAKVGACYVLTPAALRLHALTPRVAKVSTRSATAPQHASGGGVTAAAPGSGPTTPAERKKMKSRGVVQVVDFKGNDGRVAGGAPAEPAPLLRLVPLDE